MNTHGPKENNGPTQMPSGTVQNVGGKGEFDGAGTRGGGSSSGASPGYGNGQSAGGSFGSPK